MFLRLQKNLYNTKNQVCNSQCENLERCSNKIPFVHCHKRIENTVWNLATCMFKVPKPPTPFFSKINSFHTYILHYFFYYSIVTLCPKLKRIKNQITILSLSRLHSNLFFLKILLSPSLHEIWYNSMWLKENQWKSKVEKIWYL